MIISTGVSDLKQKIGSKLVPGDEMTYITAMDNACKSEGI